MYSIKTYMSVEAAEGRTAHNNVWNGADGMASTTWKPRIWSHSTNSTPVITTKPVQPNWGATNFLWYTYIHHKYIRALLGRHGYSDTYKPQPIRNEEGSSQPPHQPIETAPVTGACDNMQVYDIRRLPSEASAKILRNTDTLLKPGVCFCPKWNPIPFIVHYDP